MIFTTIGKPPASVHNINNNNKDKKQQQQQKPTMKPLSILRHNYV